MATTEPSKKDREILAKENPKYFTETLLEKMFFAQQLHLYSPLTKIGEYFNQTCLTATILSTN